MGAYMKNAIGEGMKRFSALRTRPLKVFSGFLLLISSPSTSDMTEHITSFTVTCFLPLFLLSFSAPGLRPENAFWHFLTSSMLTVRELANSRLVVRSPGCDAVSISMRHAVHMKSTVSRSK